MMQEKAKKTYVAPQLFTEPMSQSTWACELNCVPYTGVASSSTLFAHPLWPADPACA